MRFDRGLADDCQQGNNVQSPAGVIGILANWEPIRHVGGFRELSKTIEVQCSCASKIIEESSHSNVEPLLRELLSGCAGEGRGRDLGLNWPAIRFKY